MGGEHPVIRDPAARAAVTAVFVANGMLIGTWIVRIPSFRSAFELGESALGLVLLGLSVGTIGAMPLAGAAAARFGSRHLSIIGAIVGAVALAALPWLPTAVVLTIGLIVMGAGSSALDVGMNAQGAGVEIGYQRSIMVGFHAAWSVGALAAAAIGAMALALEIPARWHLGVAAVVIVGLTAGSSPWLRIRDRARRTSQERGPWLALPHGPLVALALVALGSTIGENVASDWSGIALADLVGVGEDRVAWGFVAFTATMAVARLVGDRVANHLGAARTIVVGGAVAAGGFLVVAAASWFPGALPITLVGFAAVGMGVAVIVPLAFTLGARMGRTSGEGIAAVATVGYGGFVIAPPVVGFVAEHVDLRASLVLVAVAILVLTSRARRATGPVQP